MKPLDWVLIAAVAALLALAVVFLWRRRGRGCGGSSACGGCPMYGQCKRPEKREPKA